MKLGDGESLSLHHDQFYRGTVAASRKSFEEGHVYYFGIDSDDKKLERALLQEVYGNAGIEIENYPEGVIIDWRDGLWIGVNYSDSSYEIKEDDFVIGDSELEPAGVSIWTETP